MQLAVQAMRDGKYTTFKEAAAKFYVPYNLTLQRLHGRATNHSRGGNNKKFSEEEDQALIRYCERCILTGDPPEKRHIKAAANSIARVAGKTPVSDPWLTRWIKRHSDILKPKKSKSLAAERKATHQREDIYEHFRRFEKARDKYKITPENCWNFNEPGQRIGSLKGRLVFTFPNIAAVYMSDPDTRESLTGLEAINAVGGTAPEMFILPGTVLMEHEFNNNIDDTVLFATNTETGTGYTNDQLAIDWLEHFERTTLPGLKTRRGIQHNGEWRMLIMEGHGSHLTIEFIDYCQDYKILPFKLIAHATHLLQPCNVGFFQPMKQHHQNILAEQVRFSRSDYTKNAFLDAYNEISLRTKKAHTIKHAFAKAGLQPFNPSIVLNKMANMEPLPDSLNSNRWTTPERENSPSNEEIDQKNCVTPETSLSAIQPYSDYINHQLSSAIQGTVTLTPSISRVTEKRNKALNILVLEGVLKGEELDKRRVEEARKARHKIEGGNRRVATDHGVITKRDAKLRIAGREQFLAQCKAKRQQVIIDKIQRLGDYRWGVTARAAARRTGNWWHVGEEKKIVIRRYKCWLAELMHYYETGSHTLLSVDD